jgi:hypothetical protein
VAGALGYGLFIGQRLGVIDHRKKTVHVDRAVGQLGADAATDATVPQTFLTAGPLSFELHSTWISRRPARA